MKNNVSHIIILFSCEEKSVEKTRYQGLHKISKAIMQISLSDMTRW